MTIPIIMGPLGVEGIHYWDSRLTLNDRAPGQAQRVIVDHIEGLHGLGDADDARVALLGRIGELTYPSLARGKTVTYEGRLQGATLLDLRQLGFRMRGAFGDRNAQKMMLIKPSPAWAAPDAVEDNPHWGFVARVMQLDVADEQTRNANAWPTPWEREFTLGLRLADPRCYCFNQPVTVTGTNGVHCINYGTAPGEPIVTVTGVAAGGNVTLSSPSIPTSDGTAELHFNNLPLAGDLEVDFYARTAKIGLVDVRYCFDPTTSDWWDELIPGILPGDGTMVGAGDTVINRSGSGTGITVLYNHAAW